MQLWWSVSVYGLVMCAAILDQILPISIDQILPINIDQILPINIDQILPVNLDQILRVNLDQILPVSIDRKLRNQHGPSKFRDCSWLSSHRLS